MDFNAKLVKIEEPITGEGKNGAWKRQNYIFETESQYPRSICVTVWGDKAISNPGIIQIGNRLNVSFELESRDFNGRWYTDVRAWRIQEAILAGSMPPAQGTVPVTAGASGASAPMTSAPNFPTPESGDNSNDDLPF